VLRQRHLQRGARLPVEYVRQAGGERRRGHERFRGRRRRSGTSGATGTGGTGGSAGAPTCGDYCTAVTGGNSNVYCYLGFAALASTSPATHCAHVVMNASVCKP
jgi:hypothetical protein